ncbi:MAG: LamG-like jellyroll fold domain-containing protein [Fidelibacterota bacterium]
MMPTRKTAPAALSAVLSILITAGLQAQEFTGGPYEPDSNTVLLMHFDGDLTNESEFSADGVPHGAGGPPPSSTLYFVDNSALGLGQCLRIDNDSSSDTAFVTVADTPALDLTGDWTIEGWINIFTFGESSSDWRWVPRLVIKTGDDVFWQPNYFVEMWGSNRFFSCGYHTASQDAWPQVNSPNNTLEVGKWFHLTFIRDTSRQILIQLTHNQDKELVVFNVADYTTFNAADVTPITTDAPLHIGYAGGGNDSYLDGFVDEIRISNVVREVPVPPVVSYVTELENSFNPDSVYEVTANVYTLFEGPQLTTVQLEYSTDFGENWTTLDMNPTQGDTFVATIPAHPVGTVITYRIRAQDDQGMEFVGVPPVGLTPVPYYTFGVGRADSQVLGLDFEEGSGIPADQSEYGHTVTMHGSPVYSTDAVRGDYSLYLEGDSSYLEIDSPFLTAESFTIDFWFKADTIIEYTRLINRPIDPDNWYQNNYQVRFHPDNKISAGTYLAPFDIYLVDHLELDSAITTGTWYRAIYEFAVRDSARFQLRDENDQVIDQKATHLAFAPLQATAPLRIGYAAGRPHFKGYYDDIKIYNYATGITGLSTRGEGAQSLPRQFELLQNYPNPFNPVTRIEFLVPRQEKAVLTVFDLAGRKVKTLVNDTLPAGRHRLTWDGTDEENRPVASGIYLYHLKSEGFSKARKMVFLK